VNATVGRAPSVTVKKTVSGKPDDLDFANAVTSLPATSIVAVCGCRAESG
jgi:hypothetical protein